MRIFSMNIKKSPLAIAVGTTLFSSLAISTAYAETANIDTNPFAMTELSSGYMQMVKSDNKESGTKKMKAGACGEGKCGASMMPAGALEKTAEGKCAGNKPMPWAKKSATKTMEGKCGEGKCGSSMK